MEVAADLVEGEEIGGHAFGPTAFCEGVPVGEAGTGIAGGDDFTEKVVVVFLGHVFENVAEVEAIEDGGARRGEVVSTEARCHSRRSRFPRMASKFSGAAQKGGCPGCGCR